MGTLETIVSVGIGVIVFLIIRYGDCMCGLLLDIYQDVHCIKEETWKNSLPRPKQPPD